MRRIRVLLTILITATLAAGNTHVASSQGLDAPKSTPIEIDGVVTQRQKYSFAVKALDRNYQVFIPNGTPILLRLFRPAFDLKQNRLRLELPISAADGKAKNNKVLEYALPNPLFVTAHFHSEERMAQFLSQEVKTVSNYTLSSSIPIAAEQTEWSLAGELSRGDADNHFLLRVGGQQHSVQLGPRNGRLDGFTILDLKPNVTNVFVNGEFDGDRVIARRIEFVDVGDPLESEDPKLPRCLFLGHSVSFNYQRPLREALAGKVNLHHPPTWCLGSNNWRQVHRWMGNFEAPDRSWDVITFNFGLLDQRTTKAAYQQNLRSCIGELKKSDAELIWVTTTPVPNGFESTSSGDSPIGYVPGRMKLQNQWAAEVMSDFPEITTCDLWRVVKENKSQDFTQWWKSNDLYFDYTQSVWLARELATKILVALDRDPKEMNPISVHALKIKDDRK